MQQTFTDMEYANRKRTTRREAFLEAMESIIPWNEWMKLIAPFYVQKGHGRERDSTGNHAADAPHAELVRSFWRGHRGGHLRQLRNETLSEDCLFHRTDTRHRLQDFRWCEQRLDAPGLIIHGSAKMIILSMVIRLSRRGKARGNPREPHSFRRGLSHCPKSLAEPHDERIQRNEGERQTEHAKASVRSKVEHPFPIVKRMFHAGKTRYRGLRKNLLQL